MSLSWTARGAMTAERNRRRVAWLGTNMNGQKPWSDKELAKLRQLFGSMTYKEMEKHLPGRTWNAIRHRAQALGLSEQRNIWTGAKILRLRRVYQRGTIEEIRAAFPELTLSHIVKIANNHGMQRPRRPFVVTGIPAIDQIRARAFELHYTMPDIDKMARSKRYFQCAGWHSGHIHHRAIARAIKALDGAVSAEWNP